MTVLYAAILVLIFFDERQYLPLIPLIAQLANVHEVVLVAIDCQAELTMLWLLLEKPCDELAEIFCTGWKFFLPSRQVRVG